MPAVTTEAQVCNIALGLVGHRQLIDNLLEPTAEAQACAANFASVRNELLSLWPWRFAKRQATLGLTAETREGWGFTYRLPADCLVPRSIWTGVRRPGAGERIPFEVMLDDAGTGHLLCTDMELAVLLYTAELQTVALWPPLFVEAVAARLAAKLAGSLPVRPELMPGLASAARLALQQAAAVDANGAEEDQEADAEWIRVR